MLEQHHFSSNLAPRDFYLFPKLNMVIKGTYFEKSGSHQDRHDGAAAQDPRKILPWEYDYVFEKAGQVR